MICLLSGCATIKDGSTEEITFHSNPSGAEISQSSLFGYHKTYGVTPLTVSLGRDNPGTFLVRKEGYKTTTVLLKKEPNSSSYMNAGLLIFYPVGQFVDTMSGARYQYQDKVIEIELQPI